MQFLPVFACGGIAVLTVTSTALNNGATLSAESPGLAVSGLAYNEGMPSRVVFMGTPEPVVQVLRGLLDAGHAVPAVYTQPDKAAGRGRQVASPPIKRFAEERGIPVYQPVSLRRKEAMEPLVALAPDVLVVAAYGKILPRQALEAAKRGGLNIHPSLLPRHRGPTPVLTTILEGDAVTGVTIINMDEGMDSGPVLARREEPVRPGDTTGALTERLFGIGTRMVVDLLDPWVEGALNLKMQDHASATFTRFLQREDAELKFDVSAVQLERMVRAFQPAPGAFTTWRGKLLKVLEATVVGGAQPGGEPGVVVGLPRGSPSPVGIATPNGVLVLKRVQLEGKRPMSAEEFSRGYRTFVGSRLPSSA